MNIRGARIVVERDPVQENYGSIIIPEQYRSETLTGTVKYIGDKCTELQPGDRVLFGMRNYTPFPKSGKRDVMLWERDVLVVLS